MRKKLVTWLFFGLLVLAAAVFAAGRGGLLAGKEPTDLGVKDGRLKPPSLAENSVSSQAGLYPEHPKRAYAEIAPLIWTGEAAAALDRLRRLVEATEGSRIVRSGPNYLYVQFRTRWLGFVDDAEFLLDRNAGVIHVRSASRIGRKDFGVNRARIEAIRARFRA